MSNIVLVAKCLTCEDYEFVMTKKQILQAVAEHNATCDKCGDICSTEEREEVGMIDPEVEQVIDELVMDASGGATEDNPWRSQSEVIKGELRSLYLRIPRRNRNV